VLREVVVLGRIVARQPAGSMVPDVGHAFQAARLERMRPVADRAVALLRSSHPEPTVAVTVMVTALAVTTGRDLPGVLLVAAAVLTGQLSIGWLNDVLDAERDVAVARTDKPVAAGAISARTVGVATVLAAVACVPLSLASGLLAGLVHLVAVGAGWAYDLGMKSTALSVLPYVVCFGLLPVFVVLGLPGTPAPPWWLPVAGALLGAGAHFANVLPDLDDDAATGVRGLPHRLGAAGSRAAAALLLLAATVVLALNAPLPAVVTWGVPVLAVVILAAGFRAGRTPGSRAPFRAVLVVAAVAVVLLVASGPALLR
jgi:4-hydroxybenzoate polyprenyltransferase